MSRSIARSGFDQGVRLQLVEEDVDDLEDGIRVVGERLTKILWAVVGLLISVTTSSVLLLVQLAAG